VGKARLTWESARDDLRRVTTDIPLPDADRDRLVAAQARYHATLTAWLLELHQEANPDK
jgi:hypothetical protein